MKQPAGNRGASLAMTLVLFSVPLFGQQSSGSISGAVQDSQGAVVTTALTVCSVTVPTGAPSLVGDPGNGRFAPR
jgi:hypothetical protein